MRRDDDDFDEDDEDDDEAPRRPWMRWILYFGLAAFGLFLGFAIPYVWVLDGQVREKFGFAAVTPGSALGVRRRVREEE